MSDLQFWKTSLLCVDACRASYKDGQDARQLVRQYVYDYDEFKQFSVGTAQVTCLKTQDHDYVVAFRGTDDLDSAVVDLKAWQVKSQTTGGVHSGFKSYVDSLHDYVVKWLESYSIIEQQKRIIVTGHSLGGAAATIFITRLRELGYTNVCLYTFGSPRVGNGKWAKQFADIEAYRFVNNNDIVTRIPFAFGWYKHVGKLLYVNYKGLFVKYTTLGRLWDGIRSRFRALAKFQVFDGTYDHSAKYYKARIDEHLQRIRSHKES